MEAKIYIKKVNYSSVSLGVCSALENLPASKMVLVRDWLQVSVLHLTVVSAGKILLGKTQQVPRK